MFKTPQLVALSIVGLMLAGCTQRSDAADAPPPPVATETTAAVAAPSSSEGEDAAEPAPFPVIVDAANGPIEVSARPSAIVSLSPTLTEMVFAIGAGDQVVAVDSFSNYPASAPVTDLTGFAPNVEAIVALDADLVLIDGDYDGSGVASMSELGIPVLVLPAASDLDEVYLQIETLGVATGTALRATELVAEMRSDVEEILSSTPEFDQPLTFYHELDDTYYSVTSETFIGQVYASMGLLNIADAVGEESFGYPQLSEEYILEQDPDLIFLADTACCGVSAASLAERPGWGALSAVERNAVIELDDDVASRWGPRIVEHIRTVHAAIVAIAARGT